MIQNYLDMDLRPLKLSPSSFYILVLLFSCENSSYFYSLSTILEITTDDNKAIMQNATPTPQTSSMDSVESNMIGVKMLFKESKIKGQHTPRPMSVS